MRRSSASRQLAGSAGCGAGHNSRLQAEALQRVQERSRCMQAGTLLRRLQLLAGALLLLLGGLQLGTLTMRVSISLSYWEALVRLQLDG